MANTDGPKGFKFVKSLAGEAVIETAVLDTAQTITKGDALIVGTAFSLAIAVTTSAQLYGFAAESKTTTTTSGTIKFYPAYPWYVFEGQDSTTFADSVIGTACDITGATGAMEVNSTATTEDVIQIVGRKDTSPAGANAKVYFLVLRSSYLPVLAAKS